MNSTLGKLLLPLVLWAAIFCTGCQGTAVEQEPEPQQQTGGEEGGEEDPSGGDEPPQQEEDPPQPVDSSAMSIDSFVLTDGLEVFEPFDTAGRVFSFALPLGRTQLKALRAEVKFTGAELSEPEEADFSDFVTPKVYRVKSLRGVTRQYRVQLFNLPVIYLETPGQAQIPDKENWVDGCRISIRYTDGTLSDLGTVSLRGRGNTTWLKPKKPYAMRFDTPVRLLGMGKGHRWDLLANYCDRTCLRNDLTMYVGSLCEGLEWTPSGRFVEVFFNGKFVGQYYLMEHIKVGEERLAIDKLGPGDISGDNLTGGYLLELDHRQDDATYGFGSTVKPAMWYNFKSPEPDDGIPDEQVNYIKGYISSLETVLLDNTTLKKKTNPWRDYLDEDSFIDYWLAIEFCFNKEPLNGPYSVFAYKKRLVPGDPARDGKLYAGPLWDFDRSFNVSHSKWLDKSAVYYKQLFLDPTFKSDAAERWELLRTALEDSRSGIGPYYERLLDATLPSIERDNDLWPRTATINGDEPLTLEGAIDTLRSFFTERISWISTNIGTL